MKKKSKTEGKAKKERERKERWKIRNYVVNERKVISKRTTVYQENI
jgi:hypothetical protein